MSRIYALKFLILQTLNKNKSKFSDGLYNEIAKSLKISSQKEKLFLTWEASAITKNIIIDDNKFNFYIKSEFNQTSNNKQIDINEASAKDLVLEIIKQSL